MTNLTRKQIEDPRLDLCSVLEGQAVFALNEGKTTVPVEARYVVPQIVAALRERAALREQLAECARWRAELADKLHDSEEKLADTRKDVGLCLDAIFAMADDGWLMHGEEGMSEVQELVYKIAQEHPVYKSRKRASQRGEGEKEGNTMTTKHTPGPFETPQYWLDLARTERKFAAQERTSRHSTVESIRILEENATTYEARADALLRGEKGEKG
jgi:hypothetical protein